MDIHKALLEAIRKADRGEAAELLDAWSAQHGCQRMLEDVLEPVLFQIGQQWRDSESFTLAQGYMAAKVAEDALAKIAAAANPSPAPQVRGPVVIGNIEDDFHALGRRMVGTFLRAKGWDVRDLGNDVLAKTFVDTALEIGARVIGVSAMMLTTARNIVHLRQEIDQRAPGGRIQLAVGGAVFLVCKGLAEEVGGDGTASNAMQAADLFEELWRRSLQREARP